MIQIDMKMPEHCVDCPFSLDNCCLVLGKYIPLKQWAKGGKQKWCPLKEQEAVEPFHRCIGKDFSLIEDSHFDYCPYCGKPITWAKQEGR